MIRFCAWLEQVSWVVALNTSATGAVIIELIHYLSFFLLVGTIVFVDLRVLGIAARKQSVTAIAEQLFPFTWAGLIFATLSGFILFAGDATAFFRADVFQFKLLVILAAAIVGMLVQWQITRSSRWPDLSVVGKVTTRLLALLSFAALTGLG